MPRRLFQILIVAIPLKAFCWAGLEMRASRQVERHLVKLTGALGDRNWDRVRKLTAPDYHDGWGMNREAAISTGTEALRQYFFLEVTFRSEPVITINGNSAICRVKLGLNGRGTPIADAITDAANGLTSDFVFEWRKESWKPWDWKLTSVQQPELHFDTSFLQ